MDPKRPKRPSPYRAPSVNMRSQQVGNPVKQSTKIAGKRIAGALRAEQARQQKRRDSRR